MYLLKSLDTRRFGGPAAWEVDLRIDAEKGYAKALGKLADQPLAVHCPDLDAPPPPYCPELDET